MDEKPTPSQPDSQNTERFDDIMLEIRMRAGKILLDMREGRGPDWIEETPQEWIMLIMTLLKGCSRQIMNYRNLRKGFIEIAATCLVAVNYGDQLAIEHAKYNAG